MNKLTTPHIVIFDIDGTLSDDRHRRKFLPTPKQIDEYVKMGKDVDSLYDEYQLGAEHDAAINTQLVHQNLRCPGRRIVFLTSRSTCRAAQTMNWLKRIFPALHGVGSQRWDLVMRRPGDLRGSPEMKVAAFREWAEEDGITGDPFDLVLAAYDDRADVLEAYCRAGMMDTAARHVEDLSTPASHGADLFDWCLSEDQLVEAQERAREECVAAPQSPRTVAQILTGAARTYSERNEVYGDNYKRVGAMMRVLFPEGAPPELLHSDQFHLFELILVKLSRFAISRLSHEDSIHDACVYCAMIEAIVAEQASEETFFIPTSKEDNIS